MLPTFLISMFLRISLRMNVFNEVAAVSVEANSNLETLLRALSRAVLGAEARTPEVFGVAVSVGAGHLPPSCVLTNITLTFSVNAIIGSVSRHAVFLLAVVSPDYSQPLLY